MRLIGPILSWIQHQNLTRPRRAPPPGWVLVDLSGSYVLEVIVDGVPCPPSHYTRWADAEDARRAAVGTRIDDPLEWERLMAAALAKKARCAHTRVFLRVCDPTDRRELRRVDVTGKPAGTFAAIARGLRHAYGDAVLLEDLFEVDGVELQHARHIHDRPAEPAWCGDPI